MIPWEDYLAEAKSRLSVHASAYSLPFDALSMQSQIETLATAIRDQDQREYDACKAVAEKWGLPWK